MFYIFFSFQVGISLDDKKSHLDVLTFLESGPDAGYAWRLADSLISRAIEAAVILTWHGMWCLTDSWFAMLGLDPLRSATLSLIIGTSGAAFIFFLQFPLVWWKIRLCKKEDIDKNNVFIFTIMCFSYLGTYCCINRY